MTSDLSRPEFGPNHRRQQKLTIFLGIYYYRMVAERCHDRYERNFGSGVYPEICIDLVQLGVVMFKNTQAQSYGLICGEGSYDSF